VSTTIRLSQDVLDHFRAGGRGWQTRINEALRERIKNTDTSALIGQSDPSGRADGEHHMGEPIKTVEEFIAWIKQVQGRLFVYRGLAGAAWEVESSAYRRIRQSHETPPPPSVLHNYLKQLLESARLRGFQERQGKSYTDLELLADLQHYGAATCLIDFTTNALVALWVACEDQPEQPAGKVVALATEDTDRFAIVTSQHLTQPIETFLDQGKLWKWEPSHLSTRIVAQQSVFVFGTGTIDETYYESIEIDGGSKRKIREALQERFGLTEQYLFSDFPGFALSHAHNKPYHDYTAEDYFSLGLTLQQQDNHEKAREFYDEALKINPQEAVVYNNRGLTKHNLGDHAGAIADFDEALKINPQYIAAYSNRGLTRDALGDRVGAIADFDEALKINPQYALAFYNRGNAKDALGDHVGAIADYDEALKINPQYTAAYSNRGNAKHALGDYVGAIADFDEALKINPQEVVAYNNRGFTKDALGDHVGAIADYDEALKINPQYTVAYNNREEAKRTLGDD